MANVDEEREQNQIWREVFNMFDKDRNGTICTSELRYVLRALNFDPTQKELNEAMDIVGKNGIITYEDFEKFMRRTKMASQNERRELMCNAFKLMDQNGDHYLDANELLSVLTSIGEPLSQQEAEAMIRVADVNKDGKIDYEEFVNFLLAPVSLSPCPHQKRNS